MRKHNEAMPSQGSNVIMGGDGGMSYVSGENLKQKDTPVETLLGAANGAVAGAILGSAVSGIRTFALDGRTEELGQKIVQNVTGKHAIPILATSVALGALGALVRNSQSRKHNEWSDRYYDLMLQQQSGAQTQVEKLENRQISPEEGRIR